MLEGLPAIDWASLTHAYGPAVDIPEMIRALRSTDPEEWVGSLCRLYATLCHQTCTVYQATPPAIPFLIELLGYKEVCCRGRILQFLGDAARATSYLAAHGDLPHHDEERKTKKFQEELAAELEWVRETREAIWNGLDTYLELLTDLDKRIRIVVPYTLGHLGRYATNEILEVIRVRNPYQLMAVRMERQLDEEPSELVRASLVFGLSYLAPGCPQAGSLLERQVRSPDASKVVKLAAAMCLADMSTALSPTVLEVLLDGLEDEDDTNGMFESDEPDFEEKYHPLYKAGTAPSEEAGAGHDLEDVGKDETFKLPWLNDFWPTYRILARLARSSADHLDRLLPLFTSHLDRANEYSGEKIAPPILRLVFGDRKLTPETRKEELTPAQVEVLQHLYDNPLLWATSTSNIGSVFWEFGLTHDREDWAWLLEIEEKPPNDEQIEAILQKMATAYAWKGQVKRINLRRIGTPAFLPHLKQYQDLEDLDLSGIELTDADMVHLTCFPKLKMLHIADAPVTDAAAEALSKIVTLGWLNINNTEITDTGLKALQNLKNLEGLDAWRAPVTEEGVKEFQKARPTCWIRR